MSKIEGFYWDGRFPTANFRDARLRNLAGLLTSDIQRDGAGVLDALDLVEQARGGRSDIEEWLGNSTSAYFRPDGVTITDLGPDPVTTAYSLDEVHEALVGYWVFLCPSSEERRRSLEQWAQLYEQEHPGAGHPHLCLEHLPR